jgi:hypothetical protein
MPTINLPQPKKSDPAFDDWIWRLWKAVSVTSRQNAVLNRADKASTLVLSNGELTATGDSTANWYAVRGTQAMRRGKWFWEMTALNASFVMAGVMTSSAAIDTGVPGGDAYGYGYYSSDGNSYSGGVSVAYGNSYAAGDVVGVALDMDAGAIYFYKNGTIQNSGTAAYTGLSGTFYPAIGCYNTGSATLNCGQTPFVYGPPDGYNSGVFATR